MSANILDNKYLFVIETNEFAGNFEREMCAYITGQIGDCEVGEDQVKIFEKETGLNKRTFDDSICRVPDEDGCYRPVTIEIPGNRSYNSVGIYFDNIDELKKHLDFFKERALKYASLPLEYPSHENDTLQIKSFKIIHLQTTYDILQEIKA